MGFDPRSRLLSVGLTLLVTLGSPGGVGAPAAGATPAGQAGGRVTMRLAGDWDSLDPYRMRAVNSYQVVVALYDRLTSLDADGHAIPALATSWDATPDKATLKIRNDATCADGTAVTPTVIANSLQRLADPDTKAPYASRTFGASVPKLTPDDSAGTLTIELATPYSDLLIGLAMPWSSIICPAGLQDPESLDSKPAGSGPYVADELRRGDRYTLRTRPGYTWGPKGATSADAGLPEELVFRVVENDTTATNLLVTGDVNLAAIGGQDRERVMQDASLQQLSSTAFGTIFLMFNEADGRIGQDMTVRKALALAIDADSFNKAATFGQGKPATSYITSAVECFEPQTASLVQPYNLDTAKSVLRDAGWTAGSDGKLMKDGKPLAVNVLGFEGQNAGPEYLLDTLEQLGVTVKLNRVDFRSYADVIFGSGDWDVTAFPFGPPMPSPNTVSTFVSGPLPPKGTNLAHLQNTKFEQARDAALASTGAERCGHWSDAQKALLETVDIKPLYAPETIFFMRGVRAQLLMAGVIDPFSLRRG